MIGICPQSRRVGPRTSTRGRVVFFCLAGGAGITTDRGATFDTRTNANSGLASDTVRRVYVSGTTVYAATEEGLSVSTNGGVTFTTYTPANGLGDLGTNAVYVSGGKVYVATYNGVSIST